MTAYRDVLAVPGVTRLVSFSVLGRMPHAAASVVLTLHVVMGLDRGYGAAGLATAVLTVGMATGAPWRGRAVDRSGLRRALIPSVAAEAVIWTVAPFLPYPALLVVMFFGGLLSLPIFAVVRQTLSVLISPERQRAAFALDAMAVEITFMTGPALGVVLAVQGSSTAAMIAIGFSAAVAGLLLMLLNPPTRSPDGARATSADSTSLWRRPAWFDARMACVFAATAAAVFVLAGTEVAAVARLREEDAVGLTALVFFAWSLASLLGGLVFGALARPVSPFLLLLALAGFTLPIGLAPGPIALVFAIVPAGALCAPVLTATAALVSEFIPEQVRGEAMGWYGSAMTVGMALGAPLAGAVIDVTGSWGGFAVVGGVGAVIALVGVALQRRIPPEGPAPVGREEFAQLRS